MAREARFTEQFPFVGTETQSELIKAVAKAGKYDKAPIVRAGLNMLFGLVDDELAKGDTFDAAVERVLAQMGSTPVQSEDAIV
jgi:hypothetical protein